MYITNYYDYDIIFYIIYILNTNFEKMYTMLCSKSRNISTQYITYIIFIVKHFNSFIMNAYNLKFKNLVQILLKFIV